MGNHESKPEWRPSESKNKPIRKRYDESTNKLNDWGRLERFIYLGTESSYNPHDKHPHRKNAECIDRLISAGKGVEVVQHLSDISQRGRTLRQNYLIFALAICARSNDKETKKEAYEELCAICRIPTHLFLFVNYCQQESLLSGSKGWGRAHRRAMIKWYEEKAKHPVSLARLLTKYKSRRMHTTDRRGETWSHTKILKKAHPKFEDDFMTVVKQYLFNGFEEAQNLASSSEMNSKSIAKFLTYIEGTEKAKRCTDEDTLAELIKEYNLEREHIPTQMMKCPMVCKAIMSNMKAEAKVRNISLMSSKGLCNEGSECEKEIIAILSNEKALHEERVHPIRILIALLSYQTGEKSEKTRSKNGKVNIRHLKWDVNQNICQALNAAFYQSFITVQSSEKRFLIAISCSEDMGKPCNGCPVINCKQAAAAMMMLTIRTERNCKVVGFSDGLKKIIIDKNESLEDVTQKISESKGSETNASIPVRWALEKKKAFDVFIVYSDNKPTEGNQAIEALTEYQKEMKMPNTKLIVVAMLATDNIIADNHNPFILNIVGFDKNAAVLIQEFATSEI